MRYFIREHYKAKVEGPFSVEALKEALQSGKINPDYFASADFGETLEQLQVWRNCDWFKLAKLDDLHDVIPAPEDITCKPKPKEESWTSRLSLIFLLSGSFFMAIDQYDWKHWLLFFLLLTLTVVDLYQYLRKRIFGKVKSAV